jgi:hypothetical protein
MADDDEVDPFDAMMGIDAEEFAELLEESDGLDGDGEATDTPKLHRGGVPVVDLADLTPETFAQRFMSPRLPVVLRGHDMDLTADRLRESHGDVVVPLDVTDAATRTDVRLGTFLDAVASSSGGGEQNIGTGTFGIYRCTSGSRRRLRSCRCHCASAITC